MENQSPFHFGIFREEMTIVQGLMAQKDGSGPTPTVDWIWILFANTVSQILDYNNHPTSIYDTLRIYIF